MLALPFLIFSVYAGTTSSMPQAGGNDVNALATRNCPIALVQEKGKLELYTFVAPSKQCLKFLKANSHRYQTVQLSGNFASKARFNDTAGSKATLYIDSIRAPKLEVYYSGIKSIPDLRRLLGQR